MYDDFCRTEKGKCLILNVQTSNKYLCRQFTAAEMNTSFRNTPTTFIAFHTNNDYKFRFSINKDIFSHSSLHNTML